MSKTTLPFGARGAGSRPQVQFHLLGEEPDPIEAAQVLWMFGFVDEGIPPGSFRRDLLNAISKADDNNLAKLYFAFPGLVTAYLYAARISGGIDELKKIANKEERNES